MRFNSPYGLPIGAIHTLKDFKMTTVGFFGRPPAQEGKALSRFDGSEIAQLDAQSSFCNQTGINREIISRNSPSGTLNFELAASACRPIRIAIRRILVTYPVCIGHCELITVGKDKFHLIGSRFNPIEQVKASS